MEKTNYLYNLYLREDDDDPVPQPIRIKGGVISVGKNSVVLPGASIEKPDGAPLFLGKNVFVGANAKITVDENGQPKIDGGTPLVDSSMQPRPSIMLVADDFGRTPANNKQTVACFEKGLLHHASLMVNRYDSTEEAVARVRNSAFSAQIGLHFNMTEGQALSELSKDKWYSVNNPGNIGKTLVGKRSFLWLWPSEKRLILSELSRQIQLFKSFGFKPNYFDSHGNIHFKLPVAKIIWKTLKREGFQYVRIPRNEGSKKGLLGFFYKRPVINLYRKHFKTATAFLNATDLFHSKMQEPSNALYEIMVHPWEENGALVNRRDASFEAIQKFCDSARIQILSK